MKTLPVVPSIQVKPLRYQGKDWIGIEIMYGKEMAQPMEAKFDSRKTGKNIRFTP